MSGGNLQQRDNSGALFKNDRQEHDRQPSHTGSCVIDGKPYFMDAWVKEGKNGRFFSIAFKPKLARDQGAGKNPPARTAQSAPPRDQFDPELNDDVPF